MRGAPPRARADREAATGEGPEAAGPPGPQRRPTSPRTTTRVGILLDLAALQEEARQHGGELSYRKLRSCIAGERVVGRAICLLPADAPEAAAAAMTASGFAPLRASGADDPTSVSAAAGECSSRNDVLMVVPATGALAELTRNRVGQNLPVETAGFTDTPIQGVSHRRLGRDCMFVP